MRTLLAFAALALSISLSSCNNGGSHGPNGGAFIQNEFAHTADNTDPVDINGFDFQFSENTAQYDSLFQ